MLGLYFSQLTIKDIMKVQSFFTSHFDETINAQVKKQMDCLVCNWSERHHEVKFKYLTSIMFGHSKAEDVVKEMLDVLDKLAIPIKLMFSLGMDGQMSTIQAWRNLIKSKEKKDFSHW